MRKIWKYIASLYFAIGITYLAMVILAFTRDLSWRADFTMFYMGALMTRQGLSAQLYDFDLQLDVQHHILSNYPHGAGILAFNYPPHVALLFYPLSYFPLKTSYVIWFVMQLAIIVILGLLLWRQTSQAGWSHRERSVLLTSIIALPSMLVALALGTVSLFLLLCIIGLYGAVKQNRQMEAAVWLVLGSIKPHFILFPAIALLFSRRWRIIGYAVLMMSIIIVFSSAILGWNVWIDFFSAVSSTYQEGSLLGVTPSSMLNLRGALAIIFGAERISIVDSISFIAYILAGLFTAILCLTIGTERRLFDLLYGLTVLLGTLFGLHVHPQDGLFIIPPAYLLYTHVRKEGHSLKVVSIFLMLCPAVLFIYRFMLQDLLGISAQVILMLILLVWIAAHIIKSLRINRLSQV